MSHQFKEGDQVRLKSGSPQLTVELIQHSSDIDLVSVVWFDGGEARRDRFHKDALVTGFQVLITNEAAKATVMMACTLREIADIAEGSTTANSLPHIARLARKCLG